MCSPGLSEYEIILVDDGSTDGSLALMEQIAICDPHVRVLEFRKNFGQTAAMAAGIQAAMGDVIITMDGDLQNDPTDIPLMLAKIDEGYDLVHGWRKDRQDAFLSRKLPSRIANWLISRVTVFPVHDLGCTLKAIRREIAQELELFGEMHRFIPILAHCRGAKCTEIVTKHHPRKFGKSKYGLSCMLRVLLDLLTVKYLIQYLPSPMRLFGMLGLVCGLVGLLSGGVTVGMKLVEGIDMTGNPLLLLSVGAVMLGGQFIVLGMLGDSAPGSISKSSKPRFIPSGVPSTFRNQSRTSCPSRPIKLIGTAKGPLRMPKDFRSRSDHGRKRNPRTEELVAVGGDGGLLGRVHRRTGP